MVKFIFLALAIILPFTYDWIMSASYFALDYFSNGGIYNYGYFFLDAIICAIMLFVYIPWYKSLKNKPQKNENHIEIFPKGLNWFSYTIITFGMGQLANIWFFIADILATENQVISDSFDSFAETWSTVDQEPYIWVFLSVVFLGPLVEELLFRGLVYNYMERFGGVWFAIIFSGIAFGIWHLEFVQVVYTAMMGIVLAIVYRYTKSIWSVIYIHVLNNFLTTLPEALNTDLTYDIINRVGMVCFFFMLYFLSKMIYCINKENRRIKRNIPV